MPDWEDTQAGLRACLVSLFQYTPPSALIIGDAPLLLPVHQFLASRGIRVPDQVSLFCFDPDPAFPWCDPGFSHVYWDYRPVVRRVLRWVDNVAHGKEDRRQTFTLGKYIEGGTIGPAQGVGSRV